ncbi:hypothetical protein B0H13DRAFT_1908439 [Mycena leptocephala]|nr:hypothetical protein B0H13DRAFT_1915514 [Mycena leptocephala]KAJ7845288.1 hypothetical protein B0H13DRAFT_1908439 [Mycena leptocephala]
MCMGMQYAMQDSRYCITIIEADTAIKPHVFRKFLSKFTLRRLRRPCPGPDICTAGFHLGSMPACGPNPRKNDFIERFFPHSLGTPSRGLSSRFGRQPENALTRDAVIAGQSLDICHQTFGLPLEACQVVLAASPKTRRRETPSSRDSPLTSATKACQVVLASSPKTRRRETPSSRDSLPLNLGTPSRGLSSRFGHQPENASTRDAVIAGQSLDLCHQISTVQNLFDRALADGSLETGVEPAYINGDATAGASSGLNTWAKDEEIHDDLDPEEGA